VNAGQPQLLHLAENNQTLGRKAANPMIEGQKYRNGQPTKHVRTKKTEAAAATHCQRRAICKRFETTLPGSINSSSSSGGRSRTAYG
jgi:hypothetical protein